MQAPTAGHSQVARFHRLVDDIKPLPRHVLPAQAVRFHAEQIVPDGAQWAAIGKPGLPWQHGRLTGLEHHPDLVPVLARGSGQDPGVFWKLARSSAQVQSALRDFVASLTSADWTLEMPALEPWNTGDPLAQLALERQYRFSQYLWHTWTSTGLRRNFARWQADQITYAYVCGFYLGEYLAETQVLDLGDGARSYEVFGLPEVRVPWSVCEWLTQDERPVGVRQRTAYTWDRGASKFGQTIPWWKCHHFTLVDAGPTDLEGVSALRPAYVALKALQIIDQIQGLAIEVNGLGTWTATLVDPNLPGDEQEVTRLEAHFENTVAAHVPWLRSERYKLDILSPNDSVPDLTPQRAIYERDVMMALDQSHKLIAISSHGSHAARAAASADALRSLDLPASRLASSAEMLLATAIHANFPDDVEAGYCYIPRVTRPVDPAPDEGV